MLKSSSLYLYSSNLGTFWLKIEQFWSFEEISIFSNGGHLGYRTALTDTILKGDHPRIISAKFGWDWFSSFRGEDYFLISCPLFSIFSLAAILVGSRDHRTQFWKRTIQWLFHQNFILIEQMVSDKNIGMGISHRILCNGDHHGYRTALTDTILEEDHPRIISAKFGWDWLSSFRGEDFLKISSPLFLICIIGQNRQKFKVHKKSRNIC